MTKQKEKGQEDLDQLENNTREQNKEALQWK